MCGNAHIRVAWGVLSAVSKGISDPTTSTTQEQCASLPGPLMSNFLPLILPVPTSPFHCTPKLFPTRDMLFSHVSCFTVPTSFLHLATFHMATTASQFVPFPCPRNSRYVSICPNSLQRHAAKDSPVLLRRSERLWAISVLNLQYIKLHLPKIPSS